MTEPEQLPAADQSTDEDDELGWDVDRHGRMVEHATGPEDEPETVTYEGGGD